MIRPDIERFLTAVQKPCRYTGGEAGSIVKHREDIAVRFAFCFPDTYEIGMSHLGMKILYGLYNTLPDVWCERVFAPAGDMEDVMRREGILLYALESGDAIADFDFVGFTLQYELCYTTVLNMLDLAGIPLLSSERGPGCPIVICGGPCVCNPEPLADFVDIFVIGEGEEVSLELFDVYKHHKLSGSSREDFLREAAKIQGIYIPAFYDVDYHQDGTIAAIMPKNDAPGTIRKRLIEDFDHSYFPETFVVPFTEIVHDRAVAEIMRGCIRGCRFCQAGFIYRPLRERSAGAVSAQSRALCDNTGYGEVSLCSLSSSDFTGLPTLLDMMQTWSEPGKISINLPSLRVDNFSVSLAQRLSSVRRGGLTFAPEAGTQRLRDVINKNVTEADLRAACLAAFSAGWSAVKLYFMIGLPTETDEDIIGIAELSQAVVDEFYHNPDREKGKGVTVTSSASVFVPKPFTPFQWEPQDTIDVIKAKQKLLRGSVRSRKITLHWHDAETSFLEAVFARGDRRLGNVLLTAWRNGAKFDGWSEYFSLERWMAAFGECGINPAFYANRKREYDEILPWDHIDYGVSKAFLISEHKKALAAQTTPNCREQCAGCGIGGCTACKK